MSREAGENPPLKAVSKQNKDTNLLICEVDSRAISLPNKSDYQFKKFACVHIQLDNFNDISEGSLLCRYKDIRQFAYWD
jgi:hypothetical protein